MRLSGATGSRADRPRGEPCLLRLHARPARTARSCRSGRASIRASCWCHGRDPQRSRAAGHRCSAATPRQSPDSRREQRRNYGWLLAIVRRVRRSICALLPLLGFRIATALFVAALQRVLERPTTIARSGRIQLAIADRHGGRHVSRLRALSVGAAAARQLDELVIHVRSARQRHRQHPAVEIPGAAVHGHAGRRGRRLAAGRDHHHDGDRDAAVHLRARAAAGPGRR